ncbi:MAG: T9SS type A sorting domain-containing protein [Crocinitomix sp.]|nr:T9SS type A sorting domain-containing protein [Crocinitomix sp.]
MKNTCILLLAIIATTQLSAQDFTFTAPIQVAESSGNHHPQVELIEPGRVGVTWTSNGTKDIYFSKHNGVDGFDDPIQLNPDGLEVQSYDWSGPDFAVEGDNVYVVFRSLGYETGHVYIVKSTDKGETFGDTVRVDALEDGFAQYPDLAVFNDTVYVTFMNHDDGGANPSYDVARSVDGGLTFETEVLAAALIPGEACDCCQPEIIVNAEFVIVFFRNNDENIRDIKAITSIDRAASFTEWISLDDHNWYIPGCPSTGPDARFIETSKLVSIYKSEVDGEGKVFLNVYDLEADASTDLVEIYGTSGTSGNLNYPQVCYNDGVIGVVWEDGGDGTSQDVFFNQSATGSIDFNPDNAINLTAIAAVQSKPDITLDNGVFHVVYADATDFSVYYMQVAVANAIDELQLDLDATIFASKDQIIVTYKETDMASLIITDLNGRIVLEQLITEQETIVRTAEWVKGIYFVQLKSGDKNFVKKIVR